MFQDDHLVNISSQVQKENKKSDSARDRVTWDIVHEDGRTKVTGKKYFSIKHQEMDIKLQTLQKVTEHMEDDFRNTRMVSSDC